MRRNRVLFHLACVASMGVAGFVAPASAQLEDRVEEGLNLHEFTLQHLEVPQELGPHAQIQLEIDGAVRTMTLFRHSVRAKDFEVILSDGSAGEVPATHTYRGMLNGVRGSRVAASLFGGQLNSMIAIGESIWGVQPASAVDPDAPADLHVVYRMEDADPGQWMCGDFVLRPSEQGSQNCDRFGPAPAAHQ